MKVKFVKKRIGNDVFFVRKTKTHWWQAYKTWCCNGKESRFDYIGGLFYQRLGHNYDTPCKSNQNAPDMVRIN